RKCLCGCAIAFSRWATRRTRFASNRSTFPAQDSKTTCCAARAPPIRVSFWYAPTTIRCRRRLQLRPQGQTTMLLELRCCWRRPSCCGPPVCAVVFYLRHLVVKNRGCSVRLPVPRLRLPRAGASTLCLTWTWLLIRIHSERRW